MVNRMRHNRSHRGSVRSHHALSQLPITKCPDCGAPVMRHQACPSCGKYRGRMVTKQESKAVAVAKKGKKK